MNKINNNNNNTRASKQQTEHTDGVQQRTQNALR